MKGKIVAIVLLVAVLAGTFAPSASAAFEPYINENGIVVNGNGEIYYDYHDKWGPYCLKKVDGVFYLASREGKVLKNWATPIVAKPDDPILVRAKEEHAKNTIPVVLHTVPYVWKCLTSNPLLVVFCASGLLLLGFRIFHKARRAPG